MLDFGIFRNRGLEDSGASCPVVHSLGSFRENSPALHAQRRVGQPPFQRNSLMTNILRFVQVFALGTWLGSIIYLSFVVAPGAFGVLQSRDQAGLMVGYSLARLHYLGMIAAVLYMVAGLALAQSVKALVQPAMLGVILMLLLTVVSQTRVTPRLAELRTQMISVDATPKNNPLRVEFDRLHQTSVRIEVVVLLLGIASLFLTVRNTPSS
jgi:uncharacterized membrane protein